MKIVIIQIIILITAITSRTLQPYQHLRYLPRESSTHLQSFRLSLADTKDEKKKERQVQVLVSTLSKT